MVRYIWIAASCGAVKFWRNLAKFTMVCAALAAFVCKAFVLKQSPFHLPHSLQHTRSSTMDTCMRRYFFKDESPFPGKFSACNFSQNGNKTK